MRILILSLILSFPPAYALDLNLRTPLVLPFEDCPTLPRIYRNNRQFDRLFRRAASRHWPSTISRNWCWLKAQCAAESALQPGALSPAGAKGLCQFMDPTLADESRRLGRRLNPYNSRDSIDAAAIYVYRLRRQWSSPRPETEAFKLAWASYNAGLGNILKAQRKARGALRWRRIGASLPQVTGRHARETRSYVRKISMAAFVSA